MSVVAVTILLTLAAALWLGREVISDLEQQRSASSDNVQWTLTQAEVDYLFLAHALEHFDHSAVEGASDEVEVEEIRRRFDIFYSRMDTLLSSSLFSELRTKPEFAVPLSRISDFLEKNIPAIDSSDEDLGVAVSKILPQAEVISPDVRAISVASLSYFAQLSDHRRTATGTTLLQLAILSGSLLVALVGLSIYLMYVNRLTRRGRDVLVQVNQRMNAILSTSLDAVIVSDSKGRVVEFNSAAETIFGYDHDEVLGKLIGDLIVPAHLRDAHVEGVKRMQRGGAKHVVGKGRVQLEAMRANGDLFPAELSLQTAVHDNEEIVIGSIRDISRQVAAEQELITARDLALAGEKAKSDFFTVMSHEIRTPLNGVLGNLSLLKNSSLSAQQGRYVSNMEISGQVLLSHVDTVLDIARFEAGKLSIENEPTDLSKLLQDIVDGQSGYAASRSNVIEWQWIGPHDTVVSTDAQRLRQILLNLVGNAVKFTQNGRISIEVEVLPIRAGMAEREYEFRVIDTGYGIAEDVVEKVFDDFQTRDPSIGRTSGGTGLGLGIARRFAEAMGGEIGVESTLGEGSVFWVCLPMKPADESLISKDDATRKTTISPLNLLVVEDNDINLEVIQNMLEIDGHRVTTAKDGAAGVEAASQFKFDVILMDISMPEMDGPTATRHIRSGKGPSARVPILGVSANVMPQAVEGFREAGMDAFIGKPILQYELRKALSTLTGAPDAISARAPENSQLNELRTNLGEAAFYRLLARFVIEADAFVDNYVPSSVEMTEHPQLALECHKLAGSAAMFGARDLHDVLIAIESTINDGGQVDVYSMMQRVKTVWAATKADLPKPK
ncbi:MAG: ATP-binding protein [Litoreibacter sp.]|uniref:hybrid sensor histidine kinase/response regulator n=1 Tax=Litoreibacter sp. TaxID=1969459 RepID=UPI00329714C1